MSHKPQTNVAKAGYIVFVGGKIHYTLTSSIAFDDTIHSYVMCSGVRKCILLFQSVFN